MWPNRWLVPPVYVKNTSISWRWLAYLVVGIGLWLFDFTNLEVHSQRGGWWLSLPVRRAMVAGSWWVEQPGRILKRAYQASWRIQNL